MEYSCSNLLITSVCRRTKEILIYIIMGQPFFFGVNPIVYTIGVGSTWRLAETRDL